MVAKVINSKRKAIADSSRTMFMWVAGMSVVVGMCAVVAIFLTQQIIFKTAVLAEMTNTLGTLKDNNKVAGDLISNVVLLETDQGLNSVKANPDDKALQVVLDALPADRNALALGASLQNNLLAGIDGLTIESLSVDSDRSSSSSSADDSEETTIPIKLQVSATNANAIKDMLLKLERSIRVIDIDNFALERSESNYQATIIAHAYYQPAKEVQLTEKTVPEQTRSKKK